MNQEMIDAIGMRMNLQVLPEKITTNKRGKDGKAYYVTIRNTRTGYTKVVPYHKASRYVNNRPSMWSITNPLVSFKDTYEVV